MSKDYITTLELIDELKGRGITTFAKEVKNATN